MFALSKRSARVGTNINVRTQFSGDDDKDSALDIAVSEIKLSKDELNLLLREPYAYTAIYATGKNPHEPLLGEKIKPLEIEGKIEEGTVNLFLAGKNVLKLSHVKLAKIKLTPTVGGVTDMSVQIQCIPKLDSNIARLMEKLDSNIEIEIIVQGYGEQVDAFKGKTFDTDKDSDHPTMGDTADRGNNGGKPDKPKRSHKKKPTPAVDPQPASDTAH